MRDLALLLLGIVAGVALWSSLAPAGADEETYTAVQPCPILDTRPTQGGSGPLLGLTPIEVQITGAPTAQGGKVGGCGVPADARTVHLNIVAISPLTEGNLRAYPPGGSAGGGIVNYQVLSSNLNNSNASTLPIAACTVDPSERCVVIEANTGGAGNVPSVHVRAIVLGFHDRALAERLDGVRDQTLALAGRVADLADRADAQDELTAGLSRIEVDGHDTLRLTGANLQLVDGSGDTVCGGAGDACTGLGNLIVGYNESAGDTRTGAHSVIVGERHSYSSSGHLLAGTDNTATGVGASVLGGSMNLASGDGAVVVGGSMNHAEADESVIVTGFSNWTTGQRAGIVGGQSNIASGTTSVAVGGLANFPTGGYTVVAGGLNNSAGGLGAVVSGGASRSALGEADWAAGLLFQDQ